MAEGFQTFGSYVLFKEVQSDALGHLYRAGELDAGGLGRTSWLRVFDAPEVPAADVIASFDQGRRTAEVLRSANIAAGVTFVERDGVPALACDYLPAQPLSRVLEKAHARGLPGTGGQCAVDSRKAGAGPIRGLRGRG